MKYRLDKWEVRWIKSWLNWGAEGLISGTKSRWRQGNSGSVLGPILVGIINYLNYGMEFTNHKLGGVAGATR